MSVHNARESDPDAVPAPVFPLLWRIAIGGAWSLTLVAGAAWITTMVIGSRAATDLRALVITGLIIATLVTIGASIRRGQEHLHAELLRTRPGYEAGYTQGHADATAATLESVRAFLPAQPPVQANGKVHYLQRRN